VAKRSLFSVLIELPWWFSLVVAGLIYSVGALFNPLIGASAAAPFAAIACYVVWLRLRRGPTIDLPELIRALRTASPEEMREMLTEAFTQQRYDVAEGAGGDLELNRNGYLTLVRFRRWKAQSTTPAAIKELSEAMLGRQADHGIYLTAGTVSESARSQAERSGIALLDGQALASLVSRTRGARRVLGHQSQAAGKS
jgi:hypothetical protein